MIPDRIVLIGPSGSGKSSLAQRLAEHYGYDVVDVDAAIMERTGMAIGQIFARFGEPAFRALEAEEIAKLEARERVVIATGGGAVLDQRNWVHWRPRSIVLGLTATPEVLIERVRVQAERDGDVAERPLLLGNAVARMQNMLVERGPFYAAADATIDTTDQDLAAVFSQAVAVIERALGEGRCPRLSLGVGGERSDIYVRRDARSSIPALIAQRWPKARRAWLLSDDHVASTWLEALRADLADAGIDARALVVPAGESSKSMAQAARVVDEITLGGASRRDVVVALGGGVVGDLAGFVAAIALRGLPLVQVPTSLLAMVDSSVGGKTGVNNPAGKNMIGVFNQPGIVVVDPAFLMTLPREEYRSGMAEVIKHSFIQPATPRGGQQLAELLDAATSLDPIAGVALEDVLAENIAIKHSVVRADPQERGLRMILNFGHTAGHAIEADGYRYRHGEAVALGMLVAAAIAERMGAVPAGWGRRLERLLVRAGLPTRLEGDSAEILAAMTRDKKAVEGKLTWILPVEAGGVEIVSGVPLEFVPEALRSVGAR
ncbi:MAG: 3-dehydroquinate synthase [Chloroflexi bacterium]|nr:MAG: 3-dehydroquinate synthase [Chloroflexota bacterium]